ncbi:hypothetical protein [Bradyrhizobium sp. sBnM-33]|uniref:hypothetical protein n=1 Tax=Bradyrhizobium sp. sBnM-33 TaxID=2831780 RepID=UPI0020C0C559|nr:hypothetical protein [Bradyrhizobium sp. sBnM-33]WOH53546.1 hypothetical protein RX328_16525 [Bradyrhizobium sp. sBnM-33]
MPNHQRAAAHRTTLARQPGSISGETRLRAADQPIVTTQELPSAVPLMALSTGFWAFKTLAAAHEEGRSVTLQAAPAPQLRSWRKRSVCIRARPRCC